MRIPYKIKKSTGAAYEASKESVSLLGELGRRIHAEDFHWDKNHPFTLAELCIQALNSNFKDDPSVLDKLQCENRDYLLEILGTQLPLELVIPLIQEEIYWEHRYVDLFGQPTQRLPKQWTWKSLYIERQIQDMLEQAQPEHNDEDNMAEITTLCAPYVKRLVVTQLQAWKPALHWDPEDIPEVYPTDHIDFDPIFKVLTQVEEFDLVYGMNNVSEKFSWHMFKVSHNDCQKLGKALNSLKHLNILRIHRSQLEDQHVRLLMQGLVKNQTVAELDLSNCEIQDQGALCIARVLCVHPKLRILNLCNNRITTLGAEGIGFALLEPGCLLEKLNLNLNPLAEGGAMGIMRALVRGTHLVEFSMASCQLDEEGPLRTGQMLKLNSTLVRLDVSNNWFDEEGGMALLDGLSGNRTIHYLDVRETDITPVQLAKVHRLLRRNRMGLEDADTLEDELDEIELVEVKEEMGGDDEHSVGQSTIVASEMGDP